MNILVQIAKDIISKIQKKIINLSKVFSFIFNLNHITGDTLMVVSVLSLHGFLLFSFVFVCDLTMSSTVMLSRTLKRGKK